MATTEAQTAITAAGRAHLQLHLASGIGPVRAKNLIKHFGSAEAVLKASRSALAQVRGVGDAGAESIFAARNDDALEREIQRVREVAARVVCIADDDYPASLRHMSDPPTCLYVRGTLEATDAVALAIVGTRRCSHYGREQALRFGHAMANSGFTVVSGLARGIDGFAHRGAMQAGGRTLAVLGGGLAHIFPKEHESLADEIADRGGALITEYPVDVAPTPGNFPSRNRIIAGLSLGVLVVEAGARSGALITARLASELGREAFAMPGRIDQPEVAAGCNNLIRDCAAKLVSSITDILDELGDVGRIMGDSPDTTARADGVDEVRNGLPPQERAVLDALLSGNDGIDHIAQHSGLEIGRANTVLASLQLKGIITRLPGNRYQVRRIRT